MMIEPAPKVEPATAAPATPKSAPRGIEPAAPSGRVTAADVDAAPAVEPARADPPAERGSIVAATDGTGGGEGGGGTRCCPSGPERLRASGSVAFEAPAAVVVGPAGKNAFQRLIPRRLRRLDDRSVVSYGEVKRHVVVTSDGIVHVYADAVDVSPLYVVPLSGLVPRREDPDDPDYRSHTISPETQQAGGMIAKNRSRGSLETVLLMDGGGGTERGGGDIKFQFAFDRGEAGIDASERFVAAVLSSSKEEGEGGRGIS